MRIKQLKEQGYYVIAGNSVNDPTEVKRLDGAKHLLLLKKDDQKYFTFSRTDLDGEFAEPRLI